MKNNICINAFCYENKLTFPIYISDQKFENSMDLLLFKMTTSHIMCTLKIFTDLCFTKQKIKIKNTFTKVVCSILVVKVFTFLVVLLTNLFVLMIYLVNQLLFTEVKIMLINFLKQFLKSMNTAKN